MIAQSHAMAPAAPEGSFPAAAQVPPSPPSPADRQHALHALERRYPGLWRAGQLGQAGSLPVCPCGHAALAGELPGGGWPLGALSELLLADCGVGELRLLRPALQALAAQGRQLALVGAPHVPNAAGLAAWGLPAQRLYWVRSACPADLSWAAEQILRSQAFGGVLAWLPAARPETIRRLQVLAQAGDAAVWVMRPAAAQRESSPAVLRLLLSPLPGNALSIVFHKRRGPVREAPLVLPLGGMETVPSGLAVQAGPAVPVSDSVRPALASAPARVAAPTAAA
jgi:protein ImuA